ncbi:MAG: phosphate signaling complex protein PhoU [Eubacteriales bacterium]|nr:phosphate signaling complex protein PhoU [Eubacteriales bacterium]
MRIRFDEQLELLNTMLIEMGALCEEAITCAVKLLKSDDPEMRARVHETENAINNSEREIENLCLKLLLQQQPVARDLRKISSALKMISDMERIGDQAYDIAEITASKPKVGHNVCHDLIVKMTDTSIEMVTGSIDSFVRKDKELAEQVIRQDDEVDALFDQVRDELIHAVADDVKSGEYMVDVLMIAKYLERISDHAVNIAEWVVFSITGMHIEADI